MQSEHSTQLSALVEPVVLCRPWWWGQSSFPVSHASTYLVHPVSLAATRCCSSSWNPSFPLAPRSPPTPALIQCLSILATACSAAALLWGLISCPGCHTLLQLPLEPVLTPGSSIPSCSYTDPVPPVSPGCSCSSRGNPSSPMVPHYLLLLCVFTHHSSLLSSSSSSFFSSLYECLFYCCVCVYTP